MKQDPNPRHRRITLRILEFAYGPGLTPEARECLAREFFRNFVLFAWETMELLLGLLGDSSGGRPAPPPVAARRAKSDGNLPGPPSPGEDGRGPAEQQETLGNPESGHRGLGAGRTGPVALAAPAMEEPIFLRKVLCRNYDRTPPQKNGVSSLKAYEETPRCLLAQQFTDRIETLDVVADGFKYHCDRNAE